VPALPNPLNPMLRRPCLEAGSIPS
jgi:hypothetical protein